MKMKILFILTEIQTAYENSSPSVGMEKGQSIFSTALVGKQSYSSASESSVPAPSSVYSVKVNEKVSQALMNF